MPSSFRTTHLVGPCSSTGESADATALAKHRSVPSTDGVSTNLTNIKTRQIRPTDGCNDAQGTRDTSARACDLKQPLKDRLRTAENLASTRDDTRFNLRVRGNDPLKRTNAENHTKHYENIGSFTNTIKKYS